MVSIARRHFSVFFRFERDVLGTTEKVPIVHRGVVCPLPPRSYPSAMPVSPKIAEHRFLGGRGSLEIGLGAGVRRFLRMRKQGLT